MQLTFYGCVSHSKYQSLQMKVDSLERENARLLTEFDELMNGEERAFAWNDILRS